MPKLSLRTGDDVKLSLKTGGTASISLSSDIEVVDNILPDYTGEIEITPTTEDQILETKDLSVRSNVTVFAIPYFETSNLSGGYTAIIGG